MLQWRDLGSTPELSETASAIERDLPPFLGELTHAHRRRVEQVSPELNFVLLDEELPVGVVRCVRLAWDGTRGTAPAGGAGEAVSRADEEGANTLAVLDVVLAFGARGRGLGARALVDLPHRAAAAGLARTLLLLRPHAKAAYPLVPFARYMSFVRSDGLPFDPWARTAWRAGYAPVLGIERSVVARADVDAWRRWIGVEVPGSGPYLVDGAIKPAIVEFERGEGRYREPALWMAPRHADRADGPGDTPWVTALAEAGVVAGDRSHRERRR